MHKTELTYTCSSAVTFCKCDCTCQHLVLIGQDVRNLSAFEKLIIRQNSWMNYLNWLAFHVSSKCLLQIMYLFSNNIKQEYCELMKQTDADLKILNPSGFFTYHQV